MRLSETKLCWDIGWVVISGLFMLGHRLGGYQWLIYAGT